MSTRMRNTSGQTGNRRSHHKIAESAITKDENGHTHLRHRASPTSGTYRGRKVISVDAKIVKKEAKKIAKTKKLAE